MFCARSGEVTRITFGQLELLDHYSIGTERRRRIVDDFSLSGLGDGRARKNNVPWMGTKLITVRCWQFASTLRTTTHSRQQVCQSPPPREDLLPDCSKGRIMPLNKASARASSAESPNLSPILDLLYLKVCLAHPALVGVQSATWKVQKAEYFIAAHFFPLKVYT